MFLFRFAVQPEPASAFADDPNGRHATPRLNAQRERIAVVGTVSEEERPDRMAPEQGLGVVEGELAEVEVAEAKAVERRRQLVVIPEGETERHSSVCISVRLF